MWWKNCLAHLKQKEIMEELADRRMEEMQDLCKQTESNLSL